MSFPTTIHNTAASREHKNLYDVERFPVGQKMEYEDGRIFRFALVGGADLVIGNVVQGTDTTAENNLTPVAAAVGDSVIDLTMGNIAAIDYFKGGYIYVEVTPALGDCYKIGAHAAFAASSGQEVPLADGETVRTTITSTTRLSMVRNPWAGVILLTATATAAPVGVAVSIGADAEYCWVQTRGPCAVLVASALGEAVSVCAKDDTAGSADVSGAFTEAPIGIAMQTGPGSEPSCSLVYLTID